MACLFWQDEIQNEPVPSALAPEVSGQRRDSPRQIAFRTDEPQGVREKPVAEVAEIGTAQPVAGYFKREYRDGILAAKYDQAKGFARASMLNHGIQPGYRGEKTRVAHLLYQ